MVQMRLFMEPYGCKRKSSKKQLSENHIWSFCYFCKRFQAFVIAFRWLQQQYEKE